MFSLVFKLDEIVSRRAPGCRNETDKISNISFHYLPPKSKPELRKNWCVKLRRHIILNVLFVCPDHFKLKWFKRDLKV